ncbi:hypothetical protein HQ576_09725 [bacterium]|nr:hypothetical protein [bacterium]
MAAPIEAKVAKLLDDQSLILNVGTAHGVAQDMVFCIYAAVEDVADPDTGESLGAWEAVKGYVQAAHPQQKLTVCRACAPRAQEASRPEDRGTHTLSSELVAVSMLNAPNQQARLNVNRSQLAGTPAVGPISVGDGARSVAEPPPNA